MIKYSLSIFIGILLFVICFFSCKSIKTNKNDLGFFIINRTSSQYIEIENQTKTGIKRDTEREFDKKFLISVPKTLSKTSSTIGREFEHVLRFNGGERIILISSRSLDIGNNTQSYYSCDDFKKVSEGWFFLEDMKLKENRFFGFHEYKEHDYLAVFINVKEPKITDFNYSITSLMFREKE